MGAAARPGCERQIHKKRSPCRRPGLGSMAATANQTHIPRTPHPAAWGRGVCGEAGGRVPPFLQV